MGLRKTYTQSLGVVGTEAGGEGTKGDDDDDDDDDDELLLLLLLLLPVAILTLRARGDLGAWGELLA